MSTSATRRTRDRPVAAKVTAPTKPSRSVTPTSNKFPATDNVTAKRISSSAGKENPRSISRGPASQKPVAMKQMPRVVDSNVSADARKRWSTSSSVPRGRSPSPSNFSRYLSDLKNTGSSNNKNPNVRNDSAKVFEKKGFKGSNLVDGSKVLNHSYKENTLSAERRNEKRYNLRSNSKNAVVTENNQIDLKEKLMNVVGSNKVVNEKLSTEMVSKTVESVTEKEGSEEGVSAGGKVSVKYPSKLHEKLAFLEGKVKRIACDIKRTKEILDMNNPDASKVIISDIQDKISGIEKAIGCVSSSTEGSMIENGRPCKLVDVNKEEGVGQVEAGKVKGLNSEELEARLFPHHRLLRDRTTLKSLMVKSGSQEASLEESSCEMMVEDKLLSLPNEAKPIALDFVKLLNTEHPKVTTRNMCAGIELSEVQDMDVSSNMHESSAILVAKQSAEITLTSSEILDEFDDQENRQEMIICEDIEEDCMYELNDIGQKTSTGGWFVSEGESVLLAHNDSSCTFYDIANCEEKAEYKPPGGIPPNMWRDCWVVRAPGADGCSGRYVVAASAGNTMDAGFCSWDFYTRDVRAFRIEDGVASSRTVLGPLPNNVMPRRNTLSTLLPTENRQWWYKPCGPLIVSAASSQRGVKVYDIRDGEQVMKWDVPKPVITMDYSSPLQWRSKGKVVIAEAANISLWDVASLIPQSLLSVSSNGQKVTALHVNNTDAEMGGGVRQRVSSSEAEGNDGVFCTADFINVLDFRLPSGVGVKIPKIGVHAQSVFSRGDSVFLGCTSLRSAGKKQSSSQVEQLSVRGQKLISSYVLPESNAHSHHAAITQVWGNSNLVMAICGLGLFVFDAASEDDGLQSQKVRETIGPDDLYAPSFDYLSSRALVISRDRPASWRHLM